MTARIVPSLVAVALATFALACGEAPASSPVEPGSSSHGLAAAPEEIDFSPLTAPQAWETGVALWDAREFAAAQGAFEQAATRFLAARLWAAEAAMRAGHEEAALSHAELLVEAGHPEGRFVQALALDRLGNHAAARALYEELLAEDPENPAARNNLAVTYYLERDFARSQAESEKILGYASATDLDRSITLSNLSELLALDGNYEAAERYLEQAQDLTPEAAHPYFGMAILFDVTGRQAESLFWMESGLALDLDGETRFATIFTYPDQAAHFDGLQHEAAGQYERARADFQHLLELPTGWSPLAAAARGRLAGLPGGSEVDAIPATPEHRVSLPARPAAALQLPEAPEVLAAPFHRCPAIRAGTD